MPTKRPTCRECKTKSVTWLFFPYGAPGAPDGDYLCDECYALVLLSGDAHKLADTFGEMYNLKECY